MICEEDILKLNELFSSIGVQVVDESGEFRGRRKIMDEVIKQLNKMPFEEVDKFIEMFSETLFSCINKKKKGCYNNEF